MNGIPKCLENGTCENPVPGIQSEIPGNSGAQVATTVVNPTPTSKHAVDKPPPTIDGKPPPTHDAKPQPTSLRKTHVEASPAPTADVNAVTIQASDSPSTTDAATTATAATAAPANADGGSGGVSKGAAAGIAIATLLLGGAIAFMAAFMLFKRRGRKNGRKYSDSTTAFITPKEHPAYVQVSQTVPAATSAAAVPTRKESLDLSNLSNSSDFLATVLSPGADEQTVKNRVTALFNQIQQHIDEFYRDAQVTLTPTMENDLKRFGDASVDLADELKQPMPTVALKHALTGYILGIVALEADQQSTLFPVEVAGLKENERSIESLDDQAAYIIYKRLAAHLHAPPPAALHSRQSDIHEAAEHFALTFFPWANPIYADKDKDENLVEVVNHALDLSMWLFGQPYLYEWVWEEVGRRGTVIAPGLVRVSDEKGRGLERPVRITEAVVLTGS